MKQSLLARIESGKQKPKLTIVAKLAAASYELKVNLALEEKENNNN